MSQGNFTIWHEDADDSEDLGNWIVQQPWSNGKIFSLGASADGLAAFTTVHNNPSWLGAQYFIWSSSIGYGSLHRIYDSVECCSYSACASLDVFYPNGAIVGELVDSWIHGTVDFPEGWDGMCVCLSVCLHICRCEHLLQLQVSPNLLPSCSS